MELELSDLAKSNSLTSKPASRELSDIDLTSAVWLSSISKLGTRDVLDHAKEIALFYAENKINEATAEILLDRLFESYFEAEMERRMSALFYSIGK